MLKPRFLVHGEPTTSKQQHVGGRKLPVLHCLSMQNHSWKKLGTARFKFVSKLCTPGLPKRRVGALSSASTFNHKEWIGLVTI